MACGLFYRDESVRKVAFDKQLFQGSDFKGTSINHVDDQGGRGGSPNIHVNPQGHQISYNSAQLFQVGCPLKLCHVKCQNTFGVPIE